MRVEKKKMCYFCFVAYQYQTRRYILALQQLQFFVCSIDTDTKIVCARGLCHTYIYLLITINDGKMWWSPFRFSRGFSSSSLAPSPSSPHEGRATADTELGQVIGRVFPGGLKAFLGIPYALPPVGKLRFEPPVPLELWGGGKLTAREFGAECMQSVAGDVRESVLGF